MTIISNCKQVHLTCIVREGLMIIYEDINSK